MKMNEFKNACVNKCEINLQNRILVILSSQLQS